MRLQAKASLRRGASNQITRESAFTLLEVMIAGGILFVCLFAILGVVSNSLSAARAVQKERVQMGTVASWLYPILSTTNRMPEGTEPLDLDEIDESYRDFECTYDPIALTNGLYQVDIVLRRRIAGAEPSLMTILVFNPNSQAARPSVGGARPSMPPTRR